MTERNLALTPRRTLFSALATLLTLVGALVAPATALAATATVTLRTTDSGALPTGFRYTVEEDVTWPVTPGPSGGVARDANGAPVRVPDANTPSGYRSTLAVELHKSYAPVVRTGHINGASGEITGLDPLKRYYVSVLPDGAVQLDAEGNNLCQSRAQNCYTMSGTQIDFAGAADKTVYVTLTRQPLPTAQIYIRAFEDIAPINNVWDNGEPNLGGWSVFIYDAGGGPMLTDTYGNPLGSTYTVDANGVPSLKNRGDGTIRTMTAADVGNPARNPDGLAVGEALIKNIAPGKYGVQVVPPQGQGWVQTATIEGTRGLDMWVKAGEPRYFAEFGPASHHGEFGFVRQQSFGATGTEALAALPGATRATVTGTVVNKHMSRPPEYTFSPGHPLASCWVGLNNEAGTQGLFAAPCDDFSRFEIKNVPAGKYQLVAWDSNLLNIFEIQTLEVTANGDVLLNGAAPGPDGLKLMQFGWFGTHNNYVFLDKDGDGKRGPDEAGIPDQVINLRYRDGSMYGSSTTDTEGFLPFEEVFPFFSWLVEEVDYARFKPTGVTVTVDAGGAIPTDGPAAAFTEGGRLNPQVQADGSYQRTELSSGTGSPVLEGFNTFLGVTNVFEWGKQPYAPGENGGISGVVAYATTRAENDPAFAGQEGWEPGIPRVQVNLYKRDATLVDMTTNPSGIVDVNANGKIELADVDNYPFGWAEPNGTKGPEDEDKPQYTADGSALIPSNVYNAGDAIAVVHTDSFDDSPPTGCRPGTVATDNFFFPDGTPGGGGRCYDGLRNYNQVRPAVFDGGYLFGTYQEHGASSDDPELALPAGDYVIEANTPLGPDGSVTYRHQDEYAKNVDFGDTFTVNPLALPPPCVGTQYTVNGPLSLFPGIDAPAAGKSRQYCDRKQVLLVDGKNAGVNFNMYTEVPVTGHIQGFVLNDLANEFDPNSPNLGEKYAPSWIPVSVRDYAGNEVYHTYTDEFGNYNAIVPSTYRINAPMPTGVSPNMLQVCLNSPFMPDQDNPGSWIPDPYHNKQYTQFCYTLNFNPGTTTYLDTPVLPISAFAGPHNWQLDCEQPEGTPTVSHVVGGPVLAAADARATLEIRSMGTIFVPDPYGLRKDGQNANLVERHLGFGAAAGTITIGGVAVTVAPGNWTDASITIDRPTDGWGSLPTGQVEITSASGRRAVAGITVSRQAAGQGLATVAAGGSIQAAIDAAQPGDIVQVGEGNFREMLIITKPITLQAYGPGVTILNPVQSPTDVIARWRDTANRMANCSQAFGIGLLPGQTNNTADATAPADACGYRPGTGLFAGVEGPGVLIAPRQGVLTAAATVHVDGFTITGADQSAGIVVNAYATGVELSNNQVANNQGPAAAGISIGQPILLNVDGLPVDAVNDGIRVHNNRVIENGGLFSPGAGIGLYTGTDNYAVRNNFVCGNFAQASGGGIAHYGLSRDGVIADNQVVFNQTFDQTAGAGGDGGGILVEGFTAAAGAVSPGAGNVTIERNMIIGNSAGSGDGGGVALRFVNGADVVANAGLPANWYAVTLANNVIANNVAGGNAGGLALVDALNVRVVNDTIVNNDSSGTILSTPTLDGYPAGVYAQGNQTPGLSAAAGKTFSNPTAFINNIVLGNFSSAWPVNPGVVASLQPKGYKNLAAEGGSITPTYSLLGNTVDAALCGGTNLCVADTEGQPSATLFQSPYINRAPTGMGTAQPDATNTQPEFALVGAAATDEGGNFIDVHYGPLTLSSGTEIVVNTSTPRGAPSYLLSAAANNAAVNAGTPAGSRPTAIDIQSEGRVDTSDMGADERDGTPPAPPAPPAGPNVAPVLQPVTWLVSTAAGNGNATTTFTRSLPTTDADGDVLVYSLTITNPQGGNNNLRRYPGQQSGLRPTVSAAGVLSWTTQRNNNNNDCMGFQNNAQPSTNNLCNFATLTVDDQHGHVVQAPLYGYVYRAPAGVPSAASAPVVTPVAEQVVLAGGLVSVQIAATPSNVIYTIVGRPAGFNNNVGNVTNGGLFTWNTGNNTAAGTYTFYVRVAASSGASTTVAIRVTVTTRPVAGQAQNYNTVNYGPFEVLAPGLLAGFSGTQPMAVVIANTAPVYVVGSSAGGPGKLKITGDGAFTFTPAADFAGRARFTVSASNAIGTSAGTLQVNLERELGVLSMEYVGNTWLLNGKGQRPCGTNQQCGNNTPRARTLWFTRDPSDADPVERSLGSVNVNVSNQGVYTWTRNATTGANVTDVDGAVSAVPAFADGDTVTITALDQNGGVVATLTGVPVVNGAAGAGRTGAFIQCPIDTDHDGAISAAEAAAGAAQHKVCRHLGAGDGFARMGDGKELYTFGFSDVTNVPADEAIDYAMLNAQAPGPTLSFNEGDEVYLTLTNVGMLKRPDLFDAHTVHWHGFPNAGAVFDGVPDSSFGINMGFSLTYYYKTTEPGTYMYHCHVEATEHIQMGMVGNLYVKPRQNGTPFLFGGKTFSQFVYNDGDGSTGYDIEVPIQLSGMDGNFHDEHIGVQPLPFAEMHDDYPLMNGRGYPDTALAGSVQAPDAKLAEPVAAAEREDSSQKVSSRIEATAGQRILLRVSNLSTTEYFTLGASGLPLQVVGTGAHILRGPATGAVQGKSLYFGTQSVTLGGGEGVDVLIDTTGVAPGTYLLYSTNLNHLSNGSQDFGGLMTEIVIR